MTLPEFNDWIEFYKLNPFDDRHRYYRPAALIAQKMAGGDITDLLDYLDPPLVPEGFSQADLNTFKALGAKPPARKG